jgi:hypothetical protein
MPIKPVAYGDRGSWPEVSTEQVFLMRVRWKRRDTWTIVLKGRGHVQGKHNESKIDIVGRLERRFKVRVRGYTRYQGYSSPAEAAMSIVDLVPPKDD